MATKHYVHGLVVGKFSPLHKGHEYLIKTAQDKCDELTIISYSRPEYPGCQRATRQYWLDEYAPQATSLVIDAPLVEQWINSGHWKLPMPVNSASDDDQRQFTAQLLQRNLRKPIDVVFTSEAYGEGFAQYLNRQGIFNKTPVKHINVDQKRQNFSISGSKLRNTKNNHTAYISRPVAKRFSIKTVCFIGGESTGKSTLSFELANHFNDALATEYGRTLWQEKNGDLSQDDLVDIASKQTLIEDMLVATANQYIFCDTSPLTTLCYSQAMFQSRPPILEAYAERQYHYTFLCAPDFPYHQDGTRKDENFTKWQHNWYLSELKKRKIPFLLLKGSLDERLEVVFKALSKDYK